MDATTAAVTTAALAAAVAFVAAFMQVRGQRAGILITTEQASRQLQSDTYYKLVGALQTEVTRLTGESTALRNEVAMLREEVRSIRDVNIRLEHELSEWMSTAGAGPAHMPAV